CGTTSSLASNPKTTGNIDLTPYSRLLVTDFADEATDKAAPEDKPIVKTRVEAAGRSFPDLIASTVTAGGAFMYVSRAEAPPEPDASTLVMRGALTRWDDGDVALRLLVGFGAGNARLDARIQLLDGGTGAVLGTWIVDKNSWALGGLVAAAQTPETFMPGAAKSIGDELSRRRREGSIPPQKKK
ncbi:MAG: hypothetical protein RL030_2690, partial [Pseudomonadota bacterium]